MVEVNALAWSADVAGLPGHDGAPTTRVAISATTATPEAGEQEAPPDAAAAPRRASAAAARASTG